MALTAIKISGLTPSDKTTLKKALLLVFSFTDKTSEELYATLKPLLPNMNTWEIHKALWLCIYELKVANKVTVNNALLTVRKV